MAAVAPAQVRATLRRALRLIRASPSTDHAAGAARAVVSAFRANAGESDPSAITRAHAAAHDWCELQGHVAEHRRLTVAWGAQDPTSTVAQTGKLSEQEIIRKAAARVGVKTPDVEQ